MTTVGLRIAERQQDDVVVVDIIGHIGLDDGAPEFRAHIVRLIAEDLRHIVVNMAACPSIDSSGCGELATALVKTQKAAGRLVLLHVPERVRELLQVTRLIDLFSILDDERSAIDAARNA